MKDKQIIKGKLHYVLKDEYGNIKKEDTIYNTITNVMDAHIADQMSDQAEAQIGFMAIGSGTGQSASSTDLANFIDILALSGTGPIQGAGGDDNDVVYSGYWAAGEGTNDDITEAGIFQASGTSRTTLCTYVGSGIDANKGVNDTLKIDWTVTYGAS